MAAGDQLRVVHNQLSRDPASLGNLDLPKYAQCRVPIFSLPQMAVHVLGSRLSGLFINASMQ
jgi:hypothetical protein